MDEKLAAKKEVSDQSKRDFLKKGIFAITAGAALGFFSKMPFAKAQQIQGAEIKDASESKIVEKSGTEYRVDTSKGTVFEITLNGNCAFLFQHPSTTRAESFTLILKQDGTGSRTVTWPSTVKWPGASAPSLSSAANSIDMLTFMTTNGGQSWYGVLAGTSFA